MPRGFGRLPFLIRRADRSAGSERDPVPMGRRALDAEDAAVGPPALLPSMIYREILFDASEMTPAWARPRQREPAASVASEPATPVADPDRTVTRKVERRPRTARPARTSTATTQAADKPKRPRKARPTSS